MDPPVQEMEEFEPNFNREPQKPEPDSSFFGHQAPFHEPHLHHHPQVIVSSGSRVPSEALKLTPRHSFKSTSPDIILCCLYIK